MKTFNKTLAFYIPAQRCHYSASEYVKAIKKAKANLDCEFKHTLCSWYPGTGREIMRQFMVMVHDKINENKPGQFIGVSAQ